MTDYLVVIEYTMRNGNDATMELTYRDMDDRDAVEALVEETIDQLELSARLESATYHEVDDTTSS